MAIQTRSLGGDELVTFEADWDDAALTLNTIRCINNGPNTVSVSIVRANGVTLTRNSPPGTHAITLPTPIPITFVRNKLDGAHLSVDYGMA